MATLAASAQSIDTLGHPQNYAAPSVIGQAGAQGQVLIPALPTWGAANSIIKDPTFGTRILRVTDGSTWNSRGAGGTSGITSSSAESSEWNADGTIFWATSTQPSGVALFDFNKATFQASVRADASPSNSWLQMGGSPDFSYTDPNVLYGAPSLTFYRYNIGTQAFTTLFNFTTANPSCTGSGGDVSVSTNEILAAAGCGPQQDQWTAVVVYEVNSPNQSAVLDFTQGIKGLGAGSFTGQTTGANWNPSWKIHNARIGKEGRYVVITGGPGLVVWDLQTNTTVGQVTVGSGGSINTGHKAQGYGSSVNCGPPPGDYGPQVVLANPASSNTPILLFPMGAGPTFYGTPCDYTGWQAASPAYSVPFIGSWESVHGVGAAETVGSNMVTAIRTDQVVSQIWQFVQARSPSSSAAEGPLPLGTSFGAVGAVTTSGTAVTWSSGNTFQVIGGSNWPTMTININGTNYTVSSVTDSTHLVLSTSAGTQSSPVPYMLSRWLTVNAGGTGYAVNDAITVSGCGTADGTIKVLSVNAGAVVTFSVTSGGKQYATATACTTTATSGAGSGLTLNIASNFWNFFYGNVRAQASQDGKYALFNSSYEGNLDSTTSDSQYTLPRIDTFIVELQPLTPQYSSTIKPGSTKAVFLTLAPDANTCTATVYSDSGRTMMVTSATDTVRDIRDSQILVSGLTASTHYWTTLACGASGLWVIKSDFFTRAAGTGSYNFTFDWSAATAMRYSTSSSMTSPTSLGAATHQVVPVTTNTAIYAQVGTTGPITVLLAP